MPVPPGGRFALALMVPTHFVSAAPTLMSCSTVTYPQAFESVHPSKVWSEKDEKITPPDCTGSKDVIVKVPGGNSALQVDSLQVR